MLYYPQNKQEFPAGRRFPESQQIKGGIVEEDRKNVLQWHPVFYADLQIKFQEETYKLMFQNEYPLGTKPMQVIVAANEQQFKEDKNMCDALMKTLIF